MNDTNMNGDVGTKSKLSYSQVVLYIPSIVVAVVLIVFLGISFIRYHRRIVNKMGYLRDYKEHNLHVKRERITGPIASLNRPRLAYDITGSSFLSDQTKNLQFTTGHSLPDNEHSITVENEENIYRKKPRTPKSYFDNDGYEEDISSHKFSRTGNFPQMNVRSIHNLYEEIVENRTGNESDNECEASKSKLVRILNTDCVHDVGVEIPVTDLCPNCQYHLKSNKTRSVNVRQTSDNDEEVFSHMDDKSNPRAGEEDDAFQRSPRPSTHRKPTFQDEEPKTRKKSLNSRTFPDARARLGVFELEPR